MVAAEGGDICPCGGWGCTIIDGTETRLVGLKTMNDIAIIDSRKSEGGGWRRRVMLIG